MAILSLLDGPVVASICMLFCPLICAAASIQLIIQLIKAIRNSAHQPTAPQMANPHANHQVSRNGAMLGTHTEAVLRRLLSSGHYHSSDFYWKPGMANWALLSSFLSQTTDISAPGLTPAHPDQRIAIKGNVISFNIQNGSGLISGANGVRYNFVTANWGSPTLAPSPGLPVEFEANGPNAMHIFPAHGQSSNAGSGDFYRSSDNVLVSGVCAGLAHKWNTDPVLIRIVMVFIPLGWIFYIIGSMSWSARPTR